MSRQFLILFFATLAVPFAFGWESQPHLEIQKPETSQSASVRPASQLRVNGKLLGHEVPPQAGEICVVCKRPIGVKDLVYLVKGQRVPVHARDCYEKFRKEPLTYFAALRPHGAFLGTGGEGQRLSWGWFLAGLYVLVGLVFAALCAQRAVNCGRSACAWFAAGLLLNVLAFLWLLARPKLAAQAAEAARGGWGKVPATSAPQPCPKCGRMNHPAASRCADCGVELRPAVSSEVAKAGLSKH